SCDSFLITLSDDPLKDVLIYGENILLHAIYPDIKTPLPLFDANDTDWNELITNVDTISVSGVSNSVLSII
ncbi:unnamed protein product, partial [marine sediment metagenome]